MQTRPTLQWPRLCMARDFRYLKVREELVDDLSGEIIVTEIGHVADSELLSFWGPDNIEISLRWGLILDVDRYVHFM